MSRSDLRNSTEPPWYRQFWPWFLVLLPASVVVASLYSLWLAASTPNDMVADDYYREGLAINQRLGAQRAATESGLAATMLYTGNSIDLAVLPAIHSGPELQLLLRHPLQAALDRALQLSPGADGLYGYRGELTDLSQRWYVTLRGFDPVTGATWELRGEIEPGSVGGSIRLAP